MYIKPIYNIFPYINDIIKDTQVEKQIEHENSFKKNCTLNDGSKDLFIKRKSI